MTTRLVSVGCVLALLATGCSRGVIKGPEGQESGIGLKIPVLGLFKKDAYEAENFSPENLDPDEVNPFKGTDQVSPEEEAFTRYREDSESF